MSASLWSSASGLEDLFDEDLVESDNSSYRCGLPPDFDPSLGIPDVINAIQATLAVLTALIGLPATSYLFYIIIRHRQLHQRCFYLCLQILGVEILYYLVIPATILASSIARRWVFGEIVCNLTGMLHDAFPLFRFFILFVLTFDRLVYIFWPHFYDRNGGRVVWSLTVSILILLLVRVTIPLRGVLDCFVYIPDFKTCSVHSNCSKSCEIFAALSVSAILMAGVALPFIMYMYIFAKIKHLYRQRAKSEGTNLERSMQERVEKVKRNRGILITIFSLLLSIIIGTFPAFTLYITTLFYGRPTTGVLIANMLVGRTFFNLIPVFNVFAFSRHNSIKPIITDSYFFKLFNKVSHCHK